MPLPLSVAPDLAARKAELLGYLRSRVAERLVDIDAQLGMTQQKKRAAAANPAVNEERERLLAQVMQVALRESWENDTTLPIVLLIHYAASVVMLETRNRIRPYEYMDLSRRAGELWEPICRKCFYLPLRTDVALYVPPLFEEVKRRLNQEVRTFIQALGISDGEKASLLRYYDQVWQLVSSGEVNLAADVHASASGVRYVIDLKSGFGSNEKGNLNRLLLVASVYCNIEPEDYSCLLLVRAEEDRNNNYLRTLKTSGLWEVRCGAEAYEEIRKLTGFDLRAWISANVDWERDLDPSAAEYLREKNLLSYLQW